MPLHQYVTLNPTSTEPGAPLDSFLLKTLRQNTDLLDRVVSSLGHHAWLRNDGSDSAIVNPGSAGFSPSKITRAVNFEINAPINMAVGFPLIILATTSITINGNITGVGCSAVDGVKPGNLGGGGGGAGAVAPPNTPTGGSAVLPFTGGVIAAGGAAAVGTDAPNADAVFRCMPMLPTIAGGGAGAGVVAADVGGRGGGVVVLVAPTITWTSGLIDVSGAAGTGANAGGGGGGCIIFITRTPAGFPVGEMATGGAETKFKVSGGGHVGNGKDGGKGMKLLYTTA